MIMDQPVIVSAAVAVVAVDGGFAPGLRLFTPDLRASIGFGSPEMAMHQTVIVSKIAHFSLGGGCAARLLWDAY